MSRIVLHALKNGDFHAFKKLVEEYRTRVVATCYGFLRSREDAEDVAQEVFLEVYKSLPRFREEASLSTWIYRVAVSKSLDFIKSKKRKKRLGIMLSIFGTEHIEDTITAPSDTNPEVHLETKERARVLQEAVNSLPDNQKVAITLSQYENLSNREIADIMNTTISAVESLIHRAKHNLHRKLYNYYENLV
jgi:RNA polymerase sigma-70 factor (ECF subfamily)